MKANQVKDDPLFRTILIAKAKAALMALSPEERHRIISEVVQEYGLLSDRKTT